MQKRNLVLNADMNGEYLLHQNINLAFENSFSRKLFAESIE